MYFYLYRESEFIRRLIGCGPAGSTIATYEQNVHESSNFSVHKTGHLSCSSIYARISKKQGLRSVKQLTCQSGQEQASKERERGLLSSVPFTQIAGRRWVFLSQKVQVGGLYFHLKDLDQNSVFSLQLLNKRKKKLLTVHSHLGFS